jgi:phage major head subunit gpT-like protein
MGLTDSKLSSITTGYNVRFRDALTRMTGALNFGQLADEVTSTNKTEVYPIKGRTARMRKWEGERIIRENQVYGYQVTNEKFEDTVAVKIEDMEDDKFGLYDSQMADLGEAAAALPYDQIIYLLKNGGTLLGYDGVAFFSDSHPKDPMRAAAGTWDNLAASTALTAANLASVIASMRTRSDEHGNLLRVAPTHLIAPAALEKTVDEVLTGPLILQTVTSPGNLAAAPTNVMAGKLQKLIVPELDADSTTTWYVADLSKPAKPFFWQWKVRPMFQRLTDMNSEYVMKNDAMLFGARARGAAGFGLPHLMTKCTA